MHTDKNLGIAIAGLGFGQAVHLPALYSNTKLKPIALWHPNLETVNKASNINALEPLNNWQELLEKEKVHGIVIATPPKPRFKLAKEAILAGKHLLLEKPVALNHSEIEELQRLAITNKVTVAIDFEYRAVPLFMQAKKILSEQRIGKIRFVKFDWIMSSRSNPSREWNWYSRTEEGGGVIGALGTHALDTLHWLIGETISVNAQSSTSIGQRHCPKEDILKEVTSEDICLAQLELASIENNELIPAQLSLSSISRNGRGCWIEVYGSKGTLILGSENQKDYIHGFGLWLSENDGPLRNIPADKSFNFTKTWKDGRVAPVARIQNWWGESICNGSPIIPGLGEAVISQKACDKIKESAKSGMKVEIG